MRHRVVYVILVACVLGACANRSAITGAATTQAAQVPSSLLPATPSPSNVADATETTNHIVQTESPSPIDSSLAQIDASEDVCTLISPQEVQTSFGETVPLTTQPMAEAKGPACGYTYPRAGGYLLVVQFQDLATWGEYAGTGRPVEGLAFDAMYSPSSDPEAIVVRDVERGVVVRLLAPQNSTSDVESLLTVVGHIYGTTPDGVRVSPSVPTSTTTCDSATPIVQNEASLPEVHGVAIDGSVYGLLFLTHSPPIRVGEEVKIVWRITGKGNLTVTYESPTARPGVLTFGPTPHAGSTYTRPGDEWGTGFLFDEPGCWHIHLERTTVSGDVWLGVTAS